MCNTEGATAMCCVGTRSVPGAQEGGGPLPRGSAFPHEAQRKTHSGTLRFEGASGTHSCTSSNSVLRGPADQRAASRVRLRWFTGAHCPCCKQAHPTARASSVGQLGAQPAPCPVEGAGTDGHLPGRLISRASCGGTLAPPSVVPVTVPGTAGRDPAASAHWRVLSPLAHDLTGRGTSSLRTG